MEPQWLTYAKQLQAIASTGLHFARDEYDRERYRQIADIANGMLASLGNVPLERIDDLIPDFAKGYVTPRVDVRGALIEDDSILLVREKTDRRWTLPGGFADVGLSAAENVAKEIREEANLDVTARALYSVRHKSKGEHEPDARDFYKLFFLCDRLDQRVPRGGGETTDAGFFARDGLPELSRGRTVESDIERAFRFAASPIPITEFD